MATATKKSARRTTTPTATPTTTPAYPPSRRAQRYEQRKRSARRRVVFGICAALVVLAIAVIVAATRGGSGDTATTTPYAGTTLEVVLGDYVITGDLTAPAGPVRLHAVNRGGIVHNVAVRGGPISGDMQTGGSFTLDLGVLVPGTYPLYCDIAGHVAKGMVANLVVTDPSTATTATTTAPTA